MAFSKIKKFQADWKVLADSLSTRQNDVDDREIISIKFFLKQLANEYYDMEVYYFRSYDVLSKIFLSPSIVTVTQLLGKGISDPQKSAEALKLAKDFRAKIRECDDSSSKSIKEGLDKITQNYPVTSKELSSFFELMQDVPDEL